MADPFTIIGTTAAVIDLATYAAKIVATAYGLYDTTANSTEENAGLEDVTLKMNGMMDNLKSSAADKPLSTEEGRINDLADHCRAIGRKIVGLLDKAKTKKAHSLRESIRAAMVTVWTKSTVNELRKELELCMTQLNLHLQVVMRSETGQKLELILDTNMANSKEFPSVKGLLESLRAGQDLNTRRLAQLHHLLVPPPEELELANRTHILRCIWFQEMTARFDEVPKSAADTFSWCVNNFEIPESHPDLHISFCEWLAGGTGVFHISGKPGSGKSTLMKFVVDHDETNRLLRGWAGEKTLVVTKYFFWKPGKPLQKTLEGLIRYLVYSILVKLPEYIQVLFPHLWDPAKMLPWLPKPELSISYECILSAFEGLIGNQQLLKDHGFCFFIDGLDEFDDPDEKQTLLAERLETWADNNPDSIKICVSSREENPFMNQFSKHQRLRLHLLTEGDIRKYAAEFLGRHPRVRKASQTDRHSLTEEVVENAEGVFLWVKLVLNEMWAGLDDHRSFDDLKAELKTAPVDLEMFFTHLLTSIRKSTRKESWAILALAMACTDWHTDERMCIIHYSFIKEYLRNRRCGSDSSISHMGDDELATRVKDFTSQTQGLCKGLVEVYLGESPTGYFVDMGDGNVREYDALKDMVTFTHRSIYEYLRETPPKEMRDFLDALDITSMVIQCFITQVKSMRWNVWVQWVTKWRLTSFIRWVQSRELNDWHLEQISILDEAIRCREHEPSPADGYDWDRFDEFHPMVSLTNLGVTSVLALSCECGFIDYVSWCLEHQNTLISPSDSVTCGKLLKATHDLRDVPKNYNPTYESHKTCPIRAVERRLLEWSYTSNLHTRHDLNIPWLWMNFITEFIEIPSKASYNVFETLEVFLKCGVDPRYSFRVDTEKAGAKSHTKEADAESDPGEADSESDNEEASIGSVAEAASTRPDTESVGAISDIEDADAEPDTKEADSESHTKEAGTEPDTEESSTKAAANIEAAVEKVDTEEVVVDELGASKPDTNESGTSISKTDEQQVSKPEGNVRPDTVEPDTDRPDRLVIIVTMPGVDAEGYHLNSHSLLKNMLEKNPRIESFSLREFVEFMRPKNLDELLSLIDRNAAQQANSTALATREPKLLDGPTTIQDLDSEGADKEPGPNSPEISSVKTAGVPIWNMPNPLGQWTAPIVSFIIGGAIVFIVTRRTRT